MSVNLQNLMIPKDKVKVIVQTREKVHVDHAVQAVAAVEVIQKDDNDVVELEVHCIQIEDLQMAATMGLAMIEGLADLIGSDSNRNEFMHMMGQMIIFRSQENQGGQEDGNNEDSK